jgi:hypothetical protein
MKQYSIGSISVLFFTLLCLSSAEARISGKSYYTFVLDYTSSAFQNFTWRFTDNSSGGSSDNSTGDNSTQGTVSISVQAKTLDNETSTYMTLGSFFNGTWQAAEKQYSTFYAADIYTYYSFLFFGVSLYNNYFITGFIYSDTVIESVAKDTEEILSTIPFFGIVISQNQ